MAKSWPNLISKLFSCKKSKLVLLQKNYQTECLQHNMKHDIEREAKSASFRLIQLTEMAKSSRKGPQDMDTNRKMIRTQEIISKSEICLLLFLQN